MSDSSDINPMNGIPPAEGDLDWQAFRYISSEMSADEIAAFERELEESQAAREAVARSVQLLGELVTAAPATVQTSKTVSSSSRRASRFAGAAVAALVLVCWFLTRTSEVPDDSARELVSLWTDAAEHENGGDRDLTDADDADLDVPSWMLAAVESAAATTTEEN